MSISALKLTPADLVPYGQGLKRPEFPPGCGSIFNHMLMNNNFGGGWLSSQPC